MMPNAVKSLFQRTNRNPVKQAPVFEKKYDYEAYIGMCVHRHLDCDANFSLLQLLHCPNPHFVWGRERKDALIDRARSMVSSRFLLKTNYDVFLSIDDDIVYDPLDVVKICDAVHKEKLDIVGGAYVAKQEGGSHIMAKTFPGQTITFGAEQTKPVEVRMVSTGFMAVSRRVFEKMSETMPLCHAGKSDLEFYPFFQPMPKQIDGKWLYLSEDWAFCERARDLGFKVWLDPSIWLAHAGRYLYDLDDFKREAKKHYETISYTDPG